MERIILHGLYGQPSLELVTIGADAIQLSPLVPGAQQLEEQADASFTGVTVAAPQGVLERRYVLAQALRILAPGGILVALAPKNRGGARLDEELTRFGCTVTETMRRHHRICHTVRPQNPLELDAAIAAGGPRIAPQTGSWSQPGLFSWDRPDPGTALLIAQLPPLTGDGADFGCGAGLLARAVMNNPAVVRLTLIDNDHRAIAAARRNIDDSRALFSWHDLRQGPPAASAFDFVVMNPPFHDGGTEDRALGEAFIRAAATALKPGGICWLVANRHLPYESLLMRLFPRARQIVQAEGYKVYEART